MTLSAFQNLSGMIKSDFKTANEGYDVVLLYASMQIL